MEDMTELASLAGRAVVAAAGSKSWAIARARLADLLGLGDADRVRLMAKRLEQTSAWLANLPEADFQQVAATLEWQWTVRIADLLDGDPASAVPLRSLLAALPPRMSTVAAPSVAAYRDVNITALHGGVAAAVVSGSIAMPDLAARAALAGEPDPAAVDLQPPGSVIASHGGLAIGVLAYRQSAVPSRPIRLPQRPASATGREELLARLHALLSDGDGTVPRTVVLCGLGGVGKTTAAAEYAYRHLAEVAVAWRFAAESPAVLAAEFAELAAQLGARDLFDARDPVASVHAVLAASAARWLLVFDNVIDEASVTAYLPPAGRGQILITSRSQHWPRAQVVDVPVMAPRSRSKHSSAGSGRLPTRSPGWRL